MSDLKFKSWTASSAEAKLSKYKKREMRCYVSDSNKLCTRMHIVKKRTYEIRGVGSYLNLGGQVLMWEHNLPYLVNIGLIDLPKPGWTIAHPAHPSPTPLEMQKEVIRGDFCRRSAKKIAAEGDIKVFSAYYLLSICFKERNFKKKKCSTKFN